VDPGHDLAHRAWLEPDLDAYPTGEEIVTRYLASLAVVPALRPDIRLGSRVVGVGRHGFDKRLDVDPAVESPRALAPLIDPNVHS
jgi:hypothetical protein